MFHDFSRNGQDSAPALPRFAGVVLCCGSLLSAQTPPISQAPLTDRERALLQRIERLEKRVAAFEAQTCAAPEAPQTIVPGGAVTGAADGVTAANIQAGESTKRGILGLPVTTLNFYFDSYYGWNFNQPAGRVKLLRANDVLGNKFSLNQVGLILERAPDVVAGRRYGGRVDLMFGQNTETLQGGAQNEPRPQVYRNIFQAYETYVFPPGKRSYGGCWQVLQRSRIRKQLCVRRNQFFAVVLLQLPPLLSHGSPSNSQRE